MHCRARLSLDGLVSAMLLLERRAVQDVALADPKDVLDNLARVDSGDVLVSLPYHEAAGQWHDHHVSEAIRLEEAWSLGFRLHGHCQPAAPSTARLLFSQLGELARFPPGFEAWVEAADALEQQGLAPEALEHPSDELALGLLLEAEADACPSLSQPLASRFSELVCLCRRQPAPLVLETPACSTAAHRMHEFAAVYEHAVRSCSTLRGDVLLTDLRSLEAVPPGVPLRDFLFFPEARTQIRLRQDASGLNVRIAVRHSPFQDPPAAMPGEIMLAWGGFGHRRAGQCEIYAPLIGDVVPAVLRQLAAAT